MNVLSKLKSKVGGKLLAKYVKAREAAILGAGTLLAAEPAFAQASGWLGMFRNVTDMGREAISTVTVVFFAVGLTSIGYAGKLAWDKSNDRGDDIKVSKIMWCLVGGAIMCALGFFAAMSVVTAGGSEADMGRRINVP